MSEIQDLIGEVEKYPCLWNLDDTNYQNKISRDLAWERICETLIINWNDLNPDEKKKLREEKKKRWNNLRDGYRKYLNRIKNTPTGSGAPPPKKFTYMDELYFLTPIFNKSRPREGNLPLSPQESCENNEGNEQEAQYEESVEEDEGERNRRRIIRRDESENRQNKKKNKSEDIPHQILNIVQRKANVEANFQDEDSQFLLSFRNDLKSMSRSQKLKFKLGMIQLIQRITESRPSSSSPSQIIYTPTPSPSPDLSEPSLSNTKIARQNTLSYAENRHRSPVIYLSSPNPLPHFSQNSPVVCASSTQNLTERFANATVPYEVRDQASSNSRILTINTMETSMVQNPASSNSAIESVPIFSQSEVSLQQNTTNDMNEFIIFNSEDINH